MSRYILRLDDAAPKRDIEKWDRIEALLDKYVVKPLVGIIPACVDPDMEVYSYDNNFWEERVPSWISKGWQVALHGYKHVFCSDDSGINPVNKKSEFAGLPFEVQKEKIAKGVAIFREHGIDPKVFFAPAHTFDVNTIQALKEESDIRIISDTPANKPYSKYGMTFVPQQSGKCRRLPFNTVTFCYHPNILEDSDFTELESFLSAYKKKFVPFPISTTFRSLSLIDKIFIYLYFLRC